MLINIMHSKANLYSITVMQDNKNELIYNNIVDLRKERKITQEDLATAIGVTRQTIIAIERGNYFPSLLLALKICRFFNKTVEEVFIYA